MMQIRDLISELQRHDPTAVVVGVEDGGGDEMLIGNIGRSRDNSRNVGIEFLESNQVAGLKNTISDLETTISVSEGLLERFDRIMQAGGTQQDFDTAMGKLHADVKSRLGL